MKSWKFLLLIFFSASSFLAQKETPINAELKKATVFFTGAQLQHDHRLELKPGKQLVVFQKLTEFIDPNTVQVRASGDLTILSVRTRMNFEDKRISTEEINKLNQQRKELDLKDQELRDEYTLLEMDKNLLMRNKDLRGSNIGVKVAELKEAYAFMHQKQEEILKRQTEIVSELEKLQKKMNQLEQEIISQRSKPVTNYSEIVVEVDVEKTTSAAFVCNYISPRATWKPYYDMRSEGIGKPIRLEAKALVSQTTGIEWKNIDLTLSTNDPYQNAQEPDLKPWYIYYNNSQVNYSSQRTPIVTQQDFSGEKLRGEVIDASTGESLPFARITFSGNANVGAVSDFDGKFQVVVPKGERYINVSFVGYESVSMQITGPYVKVFLKPQNVQLDEVVVTAGRYNNGATYAWGDNGNTKMSGDYELEETIMQRTKKEKKKSLFDGKDYSRSQGWTETGKSNITIAQKRDLRVEYVIGAKMSIPTDGMEHRVNIANFDLNASYEYHAVPKIDPAVYLSAQVTGWEKLNLLSGESNIYFDGTYMGKSFIDATSVKDTLSFSLGKDNKLSIERTRLKEKSKTKTIGSRQKYEVAWEIRVKNNGGASIPLVIKDQMPISNNADIKVKYGEVSTGGSTDDQTKIITWKFTKGISGVQVLLFDYSVDYQNGAVLYLE
ncbi:MAG: hypothetical protein RL264_112 [Bacteroidota bacterium]|jgi:hypothetical protein